MWHLNITNEICYERRNSNSTSISCFTVFLEISMHGYPNNDVAPLFSDVAGYVISASGYPGIISSLGFSMFRLTHNRYLPIKAIINISDLEYQKVEKIALFYQWMVQWNVYILI